VDFWAPWCGPCRTLGPVLEEVVAELGPGVVLAKVNVDENQELAMAFRVQGIPAVKVVKDGQLVQEFTGAQPKEQVRALLEPLVERVEQPEDALRERAQELAARGDLKGAAKAYTKLLELAPANAAARLALARVRLQQGQMDEVGKLVGQLESGTPEHQAGQALLAFGDFARECATAGGKSACASRVLAAPQDLGARYALGCCAAVAGDYETALREWLTVVERDRGFREGAAKSAMVAVFQALGRENELVGDYQRRLYQALY